MKIGNIDFGDRPVFLAPMEDVTDIGFRLLCKRFGAAMVYTEFVSAEALIRDVKSTISKLTISDTERPVGIQIYGRDIEAMVEAAKIVEQAGPDLIDLNFGCPVKKVAGKGAGAGMLQNIPKMLEITQKVVDAVKLPVTVKTRLGWNHEQLIITSLAEQLQDCGIRFRHLWRGCRDDRTRHLRLSLDLQSRKTRFQREIRYPRRTSAH